MSRIVQYNLALVTMFIFFTMDFFFTKQIIDVTGFEAEANPLMHWFLNTFQTVWVLLAVKMIALWLLCGVVLLVAARARQTTKDTMVYILWALVTVTVFVDLWSVHVLRVIS